MLLVLTLLLLLRVPDDPITISFGAEEKLNAHGQGEHLYNFFGWGHTGTERGKLARRMDETASLMIPWAFQLGSVLEVRVTMCGCGSTEPVELWINGEQHTVSLSNEWQTYSFQTANFNANSLYGNSLYLEWRSSATPRPLVHEVTVQQDVSMGSLGWLWSVLVPPLFALFSVRLFDPQQMPDTLRHWLRPAYSPAALVLELVWVAVLFVSLVLSRLLYEPQQLGWSTLVGLGSLMAAALVVLVPDARRRLVLWVLALWLLAVPQVLGTWVLDDAFISFRYAQNLVEGYGLTFNPGGEVVEGYTNFLWTLIMAGVLALGYEPVATAQALCTALALAALLLTYRLADAWWPGRWWALLPPLLLACNPSFLTYTARGSGMETALLTFLTLAALWLLWRANSWRSGLVAGLACALVVMTRPDGALVPLAGGLLLLGAALTPRRRAWAAPALGGLVGGFVALYGPYFAWRYSYYGYLLPNTFYAKTGATVAQLRRGLAYTREFVASLGLRSLTVLLGLSLVGLWQRGDEQSDDEQPGIASPATLLWLFLLLTIGYVVAVGGDHFPLGRFFVAAMPPLMLLVTHGAVTALWLAQLARARWSGRLRHASLAPPALAGLALLLFLGLNVLPLPRLDSRDPSGRIWGEYQVALKNRELGWWFYRNTPPDTLVATGIAGAMPYYGQRPVLDMLGLNDLHIAHLEVATMGQGIAGAEKTDLAYVLDQEPDYIPYSSAGALLENPRFQREYELITVRGPEGGELLLYQRREE
jgi:hypothetical protein